MQERPRAMDRRLRAPKIVWKVAVVNRRQHAARPRGRALKVVSGLLISCCCMTSCGTRQPEHVTNTSRSTTCLVSRPSPFRADALPAPPVTEPCGASRLYAPILRISPLLSIKPLFHPTACRADVSETPVVLNSMHPLLSLQPRPRNSTDAAAACIVLYGIERILGGCG